MHTRFLTSLLGWIAAAVCSLAPPPAHAVTGTLDNVPGATLLLPYFEVDLADPGGRTTLFTINNTSATAALTNVTLWTDAGVPSESFNVYLTGYDVQSINVRDLFNGVWPITATAGQDPTDTISPKGILSQDINFASCNGILPYTNPLSDGRITNLRSMHTGQQIASAPTPQCAGADFSDSVARGYITVDVMTQCSVDMRAGSPGYNAMLWVGGVLSGDVQYVDPELNFAQGEALPALEWTPSVPQGTYSFYGALVGGAENAAREPLPTRWAVPHLASEESSVVVWRDRKRVMAPFDCGTDAQYNVASGSILHRDPTGERVATATNGQSVPRAAQRVAVPTGTNFAGDTIQAPAKTGWLELDLNHDQPPANPYGDVAQSYVLGVMSQQGRWSTGVPGVQLDGAATVPPPPPRKQAAAAQEDRP